MLGRLLAVTLFGFALLATPSAAIVGGVPATEAYPWMASLQIDRSHVCGGSLVRPDTVLTAAHCVQNEQVDRISVVLGRHKLSQPVGERIAAKSVEIHERYGSDTKGGYDIALVRLARASDAQAIDVVTPDQAALWAPGSPVRVIGWGSAVFAVGPGTDDLMQADVEVIGDAECAQSYEGVVNYGFDRATMLCAGQRIVGLEDACQGDSGGPLVARGAEGYTLVGTVSQGLGCGFPLFYGVYGRIGDTALREWLESRLTGPGSAIETPRAKPSDVRLRVVRTPARGKLLRVRVRVSAPVTGVKATLRRRGRVVGRGGLPRVARQGTIRVVMRSRKLRRARLRITATDAGRRPVTYRQRVVIRGG